MSSDEDQAPSRSFVEALREKYIKDEDEELFVYSVRDVKMEVEFKGRDQALTRYRALEKLEKVALRDLNITSAGTMGNIQETAPAIAELDLQGNHLGTWDVVADISRQLPQLSYLQLSRQVISVPESVAYDNAFAKLKTLVLNRTRGSFKDLCNLQKSMPALEELHFCGNKVTSLDGIDASTFGSLTTLNLETNEITSWTEVQKLAKLPKLERLILSENKIPAITGIADGKFTSLTSLSLSSNLINSWADINLLDTLPNLTEIRFQKNPLLKNVGFSLARLLLIARLGKLLHVNGSSVRVRERLDAEKLYLKKCLAAKMQADEEKKEFDMAKQHPRYAALVEIHGAPNPDKLTGAGGSGIGDEIANLTLRAMAASAAHKSAVVRKLPLSLQVSHVKMLCEKAFDIPKAKQILSFRMPGKDGLPEPLDDDTRTLSFYAVRGGGDILVNEDDGTEDAANESEAQRREQLLAEQLRDAELQQKRAQGEVDREKKAAISGTK